MEFLKVIQRIYIQNAKKKEVELWDLLKHLQAH